MYILLSPLASTQRSIGCHNLLWLFLLPCTWKNVSSLVKVNRSFLRRQDCVVHQLVVRVVFLIKDSNIREIQREIMEREEKKSFYLLTSGILAQVWCRRPYNLFQPCSLCPARTQALSLMKKKFIKYKQSLIKTIIAKSHEWQFIIQSSK